MFLCYYFCMANNYQVANNTAKDIAMRVKKIRRKKKISQENLWLLSGVSLGSIKRFERTGNISLISLLKILLALDCLNEIVLSSEEGK